MLSRIWTRLGWGERRPAEVYPFDPYATRPDEPRAATATLEDAQATPGEVVVARVESAPAEAAAAGGRERVPIGFRATVAPDTSARDAAVLPFAPAAARAAARREQQSEALWAAAAILTVASAALVARLYRGRQMRAQ